MKATKWQLISDSRFMNKISATGYTENTEGKTLKLNLFSVCSGLPVVKRVFKSAIVVLLICTSFLVSCRGENSYEKPLRPVRVQAVEKYSEDGGVHYSANIAPYTQVNLAFKVDGYISEILQIKGADGRMRDVQEGDSISKATVLARVDETDYADKVKEAKAQLAEAQASLERAKSDFGRASILFDTQSMTAPEYDKAKEEYQVALAQVSGARAQLDGAELNLGYCALTAPMNGVLLQRNIEVGSLVGPGTVGFVLADVSSVKAVFGVPDVMLKDVRLGSPLAIATESLRGNVFHGLITVISPSANLESRVFNVEVTVPNPENLLKIGMIASLQVTDEVSLSDPVVMVPLSAIVRPKGDSVGYAVFIVDEQNGEQLARLRRVKLGEVYGDMVVTTEGVKVGERVIVTGATLVEDGERVRIAP